MSLRLHHEPPADVARPGYVDGGPLLEGDGRPQTPETISKMRRLGAELARIVDAVCDHADVGVTCRELEDLAHRLTLDVGAYPSTLGYRGFPASLCTSVNEVACHGIPDDYRLRDGDLVSIDHSIWRDGVHTDMCTTIAVGEPSERAILLMQTARMSLAAGMDAVRPGRTAGDIGVACAAAAHAGGMRVVDVFRGHGIAAHFHGPPSVPHVFDLNATFRLEAGMTFTIEPILTWGNPLIETLSDGWTARTRDGSWCAQFEHTVVVTADGCEPLTVRAPAR